MARPRAKDSAEQEELRGVFRWMRRRLNKKLTPVAHKLGIHQGSMSKWINGDIDFQTDGMVDAVKAVLCEWRESLAELPDTEWVDGCAPYLYWDAEEGVVRNLDVRNESEAGRIHRYDLRVRCNKVCKNCARLTPGEGAYCMHCGAKASSFRLPDVNADDKFAWPPASSVSQHVSEKSPPEE